MTNQQPVNILLVDDHIENLLALEAILSRLGQNLVLARSGEEALRYLLKQDFALILLDVYMPGLDGFQTAELIRARDRSQHTPIIFLTAISTSETQIFKGYSVGAVDYLIKPIDSTILLSKVATFVDLFKKTAEIKRQTAQLEATIVELEFQITERARTEEALRQARDELEERVRERTAGLATVNRALRAEIAERKRVEDEIRQAAQERVQLLAQEMIARTKAEVAANHIARIQSVTAALSSAATLAEVGDVIVEQGLLALQADAGLLVLLNNDGINLEMAGAVGYPPAVLDAWRRFSIDTPIPLADAIRSKTAIWLESAEDWQTQYPQLISWRAKTGHHSLAALPLLINERALGAIGLSFARARAFNEDDHVFMRALAQQYAQAIERARLYEAEQHARAMAEAAVQLRDQFLSIASHELKTPITSLLGFAQLYQRRAAQTQHLDERDQRAIEIIVTQAQQLGKMVEAMLDISRIQNGQLSIDPHELDLAALARHVAEELTPVLDQHTLEIIDVDEPLIIDGDELRLEQALRNLLQNAIKYSPDGGTITVRIERRDDRACVSVTDQGIGISHDSLSHLFQRFYRAHPADMQHISGMGIGLYVVKQIIDLHGGAVEVFSCEGEGSTFTILLPMQGMARAVSA